MAGVLAHVIKRLSAIVPQNEAAVCQSFVLPVLRALGWDADDPEIVFPQYTVQGTRVDFALCHPRLKPQVFIEVKQSTTFEQGVEQLLAYAYKQGVRIAVLTDGQRWSFYLPSGAGSFGDRRFHHLDLVRRPEAEVEAVLQRYLSRVVVVSGEAFKNAQLDCDNSYRQKELRAALPRAWEALLRDGDEYVSFALSERVEAVTGIRPSADDVEEFLTEQARRGIAIDRPVFSASPREVRRTTPSDSTSVSTDDHGELWFRVGTHAAETRRTAIALVRDSLIALEAATPGFIARYAVEARHGRTRRWVSSERANLYDDRPDLCEECAVSIGEGWWLGTNYSNGEKRKMLDDMKRTASVLAGAFEFGMRDGK